jgi:hypothetical protein
MMAGDEELPNQLDQDDRDHAADSRDYHQDETRNNQAFLGCLAHFLSATKLSSLIAVVHGPHRLGCNDAPFGRVRRSYLGIDSLNASRTCVG